MARIFFPIKTRKREELVSGKRGIEKKDAHFKVIGNIFSDKARKIASSFFSALFAVSMAVGLASCAAHSIAVAEPGYEQLGKKYEEVMKGLDEMKKEAEDHFKRAEQYEREAEKLARDTGKMRIEDAEKIYHVSIPQKWRDEPLYMMLADAIVYIVKKEKASSLREVLPKLPKELKEFLLDPTHNYENGWTVKKLIDSGYYPFISTDGEVKALLEIYNRLKEKGEIAFAR